MENYQDKGLRFTIKKWSMSDNINENIRKKRSVKNEEVKKSTIEIKINQSKIALRLSEASKIEVKYA